MNYVPDTTITEMFWTGQSRLNRLRFLKRNLALSGFFLITFVAIVLAFGINNNFEDITEETLENHPAILVSLAILQVVSAVVGYKLDVRRLKDLGKGKTLAVVALVCGLLGAGIRIIEFLVFAIAVYLLVAPGDKGPNMYGSDPLGNIKQKT